MIPTLIYPITILAYMFPGQNYIILSFALNNQKNIPIAINPNSTVKGVNHILLKIQENIKMILMIW